VAITKTRRRGPPPMAVYHIMDDAESEEPLEYAWGWLEERDHRDQLVVVPQNESISRRRVLVEIARRFDYVTHRTFHRSGNLLNSAVLSVWPTRELLEELGDSHPAEVLVVQWTTENSAPWLKAHGSKPLLGGRALSKPKIKNPVVQAAMESLTNFTNPRNLLIQTEDRDQAIRTLRTLRKFGYTIDPDELYEYALAANWAGRGAQRLRTFAEEIRDRRKNHRLYHGPEDWGPEAIEYWKKQAAGDV
jgi:hypothetical protein